MYPINERLLCTSTRYDVKSEIQRIKKEIE